MLTSSRWRSWHEFVEELIQLFHFPAKDAQPRVRGVIRCGKNKGTHLGTHLGTELLNTLIGSCKMRLRQHAQRETGSGCDRHLARVGGEDFQRP